MAVLMLNFVFMLVCLRLASDLLDFGDKYVKTNTDRRTLWRQNVGEDLYSGNILVRFAWMVAGVFWTGGVKGPQWVLQSYTARVA